MGCSSSQSAKVATAETKENGINEEMEGDRKYPPGEAFEVSLDKESESIIKKHPPKRLQRLVEAPSSQTTIEELEEKLANAEIRRNQFLLERVSTLKAKDDETDVNDNKNLTNDDEHNEAQNEEMHNESPAITETPLETPSTATLAVDDFNENNSQENK